jgi:hypothetical protein
MVRLAGAISGRGAWHASGRTLSAPATSKEYSVADKGVTP